MCAGSSCWSSFKGFFRLTKPGSTPPPWKLIILLYIALLGSTYSITFLFPFIPDMILWFGYAEEDKGFYGGLVASSMFAGRIFSSYIWGWLSDKKGRKTILMISLVCIAITNFAFGFTTNLASAIGVRFVSGLSNGVVTIVKATIYEISDSSNQAAGMSVIALGWGTGVVVGPFISGYIANPATKYPLYFGESEFLLKYPFFLPSLVAGIISFMPAIVVWFFLPETNKDPSTADSEGAGNEDVKSSPGVYSLKSDLENSPADSGLPASILQDSSDQDPYCSYFSFKCEGDDIPQDISAYDPLSDDIAYMDDEESESGSAVFQYMYGVGLPSQSVGDVSRLTIDETPTKSVQGLYDVPDPLQNDSNVPDAANNELLTPKAEVKAKKQSKLMRLMNIRDVRFTIVLSTLMSFATIGFKEIFTIWASTEVPLGGLGFSSEQIGKAIGLSSLPLVTLQILLFPKVEGCLGSINTYAAFNNILIATSVSTVCFRVLHARLEVLWPLLLISMALENLATVTCFSALGLLLNNSVHPKMAGSLNGLAMTVSAIGRSLAPTLGGGLYTWSLTKGKDMGFPFDVNLVFLMFGLCYFFASVLVAQMPRHLDKQTKKDAVSVKRYRKDTLTRVNTNQVFLSSMDLDESTKERH